MVYMVLESFDIDRRITLNSLIIDVAIDELRKEMATLMMMTEDQEQFFYYLVGRNLTEPSLPLVRKYEVAYNLRYVTPCCPNADTFDTMRFPLAERVKEVYVLREKALEEASRGGKHKRR